MLIGSARSKLSSVISSFDLCRIPALSDLKKPLRFAEFKYLDGIRSANGTEITEPHCRICCAITKLGGFVEEKAGRGYSTNPAPLRLESTVQPKKIPMKFEKRDAA